MDTAVRDEPQQMHPAASLEGGAEHRVVEQRPVFGRPVHAHRVLVEAPAAADRQVADLAVSHLSGGESGRLAGRVELRVRELAPEPVEHRRLRELDGVPRPGRRAAPAIEDDERYEVDAARQIAANEETSSDAPPTSAPSTPGCSSSSAALSGLTEPP